MKLKTVFTVLMWIGIVSLVCPLLGCTKKEESNDSREQYRIGYSLFYGSNPFVIAMVDGAQQCIEDWERNGVTVELIITRGSDTDSSQQVTDCEDIYTQGVDGLLIFPGAGSKLMSAPVKNLFNDNDIPVVVTDIGLSDAEWVSFITSDNYLGGQMAAQLIADHLPPGANVMTFDSSPSTENCIIRQNGFEKTADNLGFTVLPEKVLNKNLEDGRRVIEDVLIAYPDIDAIFHINQITAQGSISNTPLSRSARPLHIAFDIDSSSLQMVKNGKILGLIVQNPFLIGYEGMNQMLLHLTGKETEQYINIPPLLCTSKNADDFNDDPQVNQ
jgi:ribose transport system substrate-binding protein